MAPSFHDPRSAAWLVTLERAIVAHEIDPPTPGDRLAIADSAILLLHRDRAQPCGCTPASLRIARSWSPIVSLCPTHAPFAHPSSPSPRAIFD